jgi:carboxylesterase type B
MDEDCLALNIFKPDTISNAEGLPVLVWIHGGSYQNGYSALPAYNMSYLVAESQAMGKPIIGVSINYRLAFFGFLASNEVINSRNANLGLKDQQLAFQWIQDNIASFGGDPEKVTIWGESA